MSEDRPRQAGPQHPQPSVAEAADSSQHRRKRLSADLPQNWLHDPAYWTLSDRAWRLHTHGLMWCIGRTDGFVPKDMLSMLQPGSDAARQAAVRELMTAGHWEPVTGGWQVCDWEASQSTVEQIETGRVRAAERQRKHRSGDVTPDVTRDKRREYGTARNGTSRDGSDRSSSITDAEFARNPWADAGDESR